MALLDVSQGMARIGVLEMVTRNILRISFGKLWLAVLFALIGLSLALQIGLDPRILRLPSCSRPIVHLPRHLPIRQACW